MAVKNRLDGLPVSEILARGREEIVTGARDQLSKVVFGKEMFHLMDLAIVAVFADGHLMIRAPIGLGKTLFCDALGRTIGGTFMRIQLTPDTLPKDLKGFTVFNEETKKYEILPAVLREGVVVVLADEINRTPPKTQAAFLEAMEERRVTITGVGSKELQLGEVFIVLATRNPVEQTGTYELPEAQLDRFFAQAIIDEPSEETLLQIVEDVDYWRRSKVRLDQRIHSVTNPAEIVTLREAILGGGIRVDPKIDQYIVALVLTTREHEAVKRQEGDFGRGYGSSPRGAVNLKKAAKIAAFFAGRDYVLTDDVKRFAKDILAHRIFIKPEMKDEVSGAKIVDWVIGRVQEPKISTR